MTSQGVGKVLKQIPNLEFVSNLGDFSNIADDAARQEGRAAGVRAAGWAGTAYSDGMGAGGKGGHDN